MGDHHEIVELRAVANRGGPVGAAIDRGAGTDLDVVADLHPAQLRRQAIAAVNHLIAEAIGPKHGTGVDHAPCPHLRAVVQHRIRKDDCAGADPAAGHDLGAGVNGGTWPDLDIRTDHGERVNVGIGADAGRGVDDCPRADADAGGSAGRPQADDHRGKCRMHVGHLDRRPIQRARTLRHDHRACATLRQEMQFVGCIDERDVGRSCRLQRRCAADRQPCCAADDRSLDMAGEFFKRDGHGILHGGGPLRYRFGYRWAQPGREGRKPEGVVQEGLRPCAGPAGSLTAPAPARSRDRPACRTRWPATWAARRRPAGARPRPATWLPARGTAAGSRSCPPL